MNTMITDAAKFTKRPVTIEAMQFDGTQESASRIARWANADDEKAGRDDSTFSYCVREGDSAVYDVIVWTLEDAMSASPGDWIIKGVKGEFYPCKPDIFELTYQAGSGSPGSVGELIRCARSEFRDSDAAGDVLDWMEELCATAPEAGNPVSVSERERFEIWARRECYDCSHSIFNELNYKQTHTQIAWEAWQEAINSRVK